MGLSVFYKNFNSVFFAIKNISFYLFPCEIVGLVGESGSGKTTLGRVLCGIERDYVGAFFYPKNCSFLKKRVQMVYQDPFSSFNPKKTVGNSVLEIIKLYNFSFSVENLFKLVSLDADYIHKYPHELSGGEKQRVSIARVLASCPKVIVFDESLSGLDTETQYFILNIIRFINTFLKISIVFISHDINSVYYLCNIIVVLKSCKIVDNFKSKYLYSKKRNAYTKKFINDSFLN